MLRSFYSLAWLIEVDRCSNCGIMWFDRDELQMLQCLVEHRIAPRVPGTAPDSTVPLGQDRKESL
jgi:Zn-finger nucleic acid-binding protein